MINKDLPRPEGLPENLTPAQRDRIGVFHHALSRWKDIQASIKEGNIRWVTNVSAPDESAVFGINQSLGNAIKKVAFAVYQDGIQQDPALKAVAEGMLRDIVGVEPISGQVASTSDAQTSNENSVSKMIKKTAW